MLGTEVVRALRQFAEMPFILVSGFLTITTAVQAMKLGAVDVIEKPVEIDELVTTVQRAVGAHGIADEGGRFESPFAYAGDGTSGATSLGLSRGRSTAERWVTHVIKATGAPDDFKTLQEWAALAAVSYTMGNVHLKWALSEAAVFFPRHADYADRSKVLERRPPHALSIEYFGGCVRFELAADGTGGTDLFLTLDCFSEKAITSRPSSSSDHISPYSCVRCRPSASARLVVFWRRDVTQRAEAGSLGSLQQVTSGVRLVGKLPARLDYNVEMDVQRGTLGPDSVRAWAGHWQIRETLPVAGTPRITAEYNYASGDADPADGIRGRFDPLYPTAHDKYGLADQVGWRNIHHARVGFDVTPITATPITVSYHSYWLAERRDALYAASGAALARVAAGATSTHVGEEIDVQMTGPLTASLALAAGYAHLFTGPFLRQATPGKSYSGPFVMVTYVFLAER